MKALLAASLSVHEVGFGVVMGGLGGMWIGGGNFLARRHARRRFGQLGSERSIWFRKGFFYSPDWLSVPILATGVAAFVCGLIVMAVA